MIGKKMFFIKAFLQSEKLKDQLNFEDFLNVYTKDKLTEFINSSIHNERSNEKSLSLILNRIKWMDKESLFKKEALNKMFEVVRYEIRECDILAHWEKDEFIILLPECSYESAEKIALLIKSIVEGKTFINQKISLDYSIVEHRDEDTIDSFMERAYEALETHVTI